VSATQKEVLATLRYQIHDRFSGPELKILCRDVGVDYEGLEGNTKEEKAYELVEACRQREIISDLINVCRKRRPQTSWPNWPPPLTFDFSNIPPIKFAANASPSVETSQPIASLDIDTILTSHHTPSTTPATEVSLPATKPGSPTSFDKLFLALLFAAIGFVIATVVFNGTKSHHILDTFIVYEFEVEGNSIPPQISPINNSYTLSALITDAFYVDIEGDHSLALSVALPPFNGIDQYSGLSIDLSERPKVDAISAYLYIPLTATLPSSTFQVEFVAMDELGREFRSGYSTVKVGEWTPLFWGTRYFASQSNLCLDGNYDNQCDAPVGSWSQSWQDTYVVGFDIRVARNGEPYQGIIYFDKIEVYQVSSLLAATPTLPLDPIPTATP
jgi:hypothetical protein